MQYNNYKYQAEHLLIELGIKLIQNFISDFKPIEFGIKSIMNI